MIALGSLVVGIVGLYFLVKYVGYTNQIATEARNQTEASFKPALIPIPGANTEADCSLKNIGKGPALNVEWEITGTSQKGSFGYIEAGGVVEMHPSNFFMLTVGAMKSQSKNDVAIVCSYKSISGKQYTSISKHVLSHKDPGSDRFDTTFTG